MKRLAWCLLYGFAGLAQAAINDVTFHGTLRFATRLYYQRW